MIYVVVIIATVFISLAFSGAAPAWLIVGMPSAILFVVALRLIYWIKSRATVDHKDIDRIRRDIRITEIVGPSIALSFMLIGIGMRMFVDTYQQSLAVVLIWITAVICAFGLAALPTISKRVVLSAGLPLTVSYLWSSNDVMMLLGGLFAVTTCLVIYMLDQNYAAFRTIVHSRATATELAYTDFLTNLANRRYFEFLLTERVSDPALLNKPFAVGIIDLDGFKPVNDVHGHRAGDGVLIETAARLEAFMKGRGKAARMGGDEFAVLVEGVSCENDAIAFAKEMRQIFASPFPVQDIAVQLSCSCGFSIYPSSGTDADRLIDQADMALYKSKALERGSASVFTASYEDFAMERAKLEQRLRLAVAASDMTVHFQPIFDLSSMRVTGFEALARWYDPELGHISPAIFIPVAEQAGLIEILTDDLLRKAAAVAVTWPGHLLLSFNLSAAQLVKPSAGLRILSILAQEGLLPHQFEAEVTESTLMKDIDAARLTLGCLKAAGVGISLDDFGTGHSSLSQIRDLPLDKVKIDKSFVDQICYDAKIENLVHAIISMCRTLELRCVAEGVEDEFQLIALKAAGCTLGQGYLFSRPVQAEQIPEIVARADRATA